MLYSVPRLGMSQRLLLGGNFSRRRTWICLLFDTCIEVWSFAKDILYSRCSLWPSQMREFFGKPAATVSSLGKRCRRRKRGGSLLVGGRWRRSYPRWCQQSSQICLLRTFLALLRSLLQPSFIRSDKGIIDLVLLRILWWGDPSWSSC